MFRSPFRLITGGVAASALLLSPVLAPVTASADDSTSPKNVIVLIGDGMGYNQVDLANELLSGEHYYQLTTGNDNKVNVSGSNSVRPTDPDDFQSWDLVSMSTNWFDGPTYDPSQVWTDFDWVKDSPTDSAAAGTALATGHKTYNAGVGVDNDGNEVENLSERAKSLGKSAGVVSSVQFSHATPATYSSHNESRNNLQEIANEQLSGVMDVVIGAGHPHFDDDNQPSSTPDYGYISEADWERLTTDQTDYTFVESNEDFYALGEGDTPDKVFGVPQVRSTLQQGRSAGAERNDVPELADLTKAALNVLDDNDEGMFLMVEGGAIDWSGHANETDRIAEETVEFMGAVDQVVDWVNTNSSWDETLVVVTADHETGYLNGPAESTHNPILEYPQAGWNSTDHTSQLVPFFYRGAGAEAVEEMADQLDPVRGDYLDNTELAEWLLTTAWVEGDGGEPTPTPSPTSDPTGPTSPEPTPSASETTPPTRDPEDRPGLPKTGA